MYILRDLAFFFLTQVVLAQQPTPSLPDLKLTPGDTFDVTAQDVCVPGYAKKVRTYAHYCTAHQAARDSQTRPAEQAAALQPRSIQIWIMAARIQSRQTHRRRWSALR
jgi:hypothetical protein